MPMRRCHCLASGKMHCMQADLIPGLRLPSAHRSAAPGISQRAEQPDGWLVTFRSAGAMPPLFCICSSGGDVSDFNDLAQILPVDQPVYGFGVPPLEPAGDRFPSVQQLAAIYVAKMRSLQPHGPYQLCGHSFGGVVAYEMAVLLAKAGEPIGLVALIDTLHPAFRRNMSTAQRLRFRSAYFADRTAKYVGNLRHGRIDRLFGDALHFVLGRCKHASWKIVRQVFGRSGGPLPGTINIDEMVLVSAWHRYQPSLYGGRLILLKAADRPPEYARDDTLGWGQYGSGGIDIHVIPGNHLSIMHLPDVLTLAERIAPYLARR
jgi:thioesterase domain-containing protein